jgi:acetolactate synthase I/III small subunit
MTHLPRAPRLFIAYVEDQPGVLNRISSLFRRRSYNIVSLNVGRTHEPGISRMTVVVEATAEESDRIAANLYKLVNVLSVEDITDQAALSRDLALIKVSVSADRRAELIQLCESFRGRAVDINPDSIVIELSGDQAKIDGLLRMLESFEILEMVQTGTISMTRGGKGRAAQAAKAQPPLRQVG